MTTLGFVVKLWIGHYFDALLSHAGGRSTELCNAIGMVSPARKPHGPFTMFGQGSVFGISAYRLVKPNIVLTPKTVFDMVVIGQIQFDGVVRAGYICPVLLGQYCSRNPLTTLKGTTSVAIYRSIAINNSANPVHYRFFGYKAWGNLLEIGPACDVRSRSVQ
ncbi:hypothetical protein [Limnobacter thiooxidans]|uniref:hypothetical protein n=1 Tax=Limnobacter thiooxidans TaxID=131080 RepID=UPI00102D7F69